MIRHFAAVDTYTYLSDIYGHPAEGEGAVELKELAQQFLCDKAMGESS